MQLDSEQLSAVVSKSNALCIIAGPGSGKTRVLTARIAHLLETQTGFAPRATAVTFTRKAAAELSQRLEMLVGASSKQMRVGTFHWLALEGLRIGWGKRSKRPPAILQDLARLATRLRPKVDRVWLEMALEEISWAQARLLTPEDYETAALCNGRPPWGEPKEVAELYWELTTEKRRKHVLDLGDLIPAYLDLFESDQEFAAAQRWMAKAVFVDEMQDSNLAQLAVLSAWLDLPEMREWARKRALYSPGATPTCHDPTPESSNDKLFVLEEDRSLCLVGDPDQAIYSWNGSDPELMWLLPKLFQDMEVVELRANYRSKSEIALAASRLIESKPGQSGVSFGREAGTLLETSDRLPHAPSSSESPVISIVSRNDEQEEALGVASELCQWASLATGWQSCAVLARTRQQLRSLARVLQAEGIPWQMREPSPEGSSDSEESSDYGTVQLLSFHQAKGLEWDAVWLIGLEEGLVPYWSCLAKAQIEEERRVLYVAFTRAKLQLRGSWCRNRTLADGRTLTCKPSRFLSDLGSNIDLVHLEIPQGRPNRIETKPLPVILGKERGDSKT
jgi:DNA helicase-2/ATP-dependent DNA helicase PcrA